MFYKNVFFKKKLLMDMFIYDDHEVNFDQQQGGFRDKVFNPKEQQR